MIDAVGSVHTRKAALEAVRPGGTIMHVGLQDWASEIDLRKLREDRKRQINLLLDHCGLGWSEACMGEARSEPQIGDWPVDRIVANRDAHHAAWRARYPQLWA